MSKKEDDPIVVVPLFTKSYNRYVDVRMKQAMEEMLNTVPEDIQYVDFNDFEGLFTDADFMDTDHMSRQGAEKFSTCLVETFGK